MYTNTKKYRAVRLDILKKWLKSRCMYSEDVFNDPGYSDFYKSFFYNIYEDDTYTDGDIDHQLNIGFYEQIELNENSNYIDCNIEHFVDFIPSGLSKRDIEALSSSYVEPLKEKAFDVFSRKGILILPGSNHSNASYLFKRIKVALSNVKPFRVPYEDDNGITIVDEKLTIDKLEVYNFVYYVSTQDFNLRSAIKLINLDKEIENDTVNNAEDEFEDEFEDEIKDEFEDEFEDEIKDEFENEFEDSSTFELNRDKVLIETIMQEIEKELYRYNDIVEQLWDNIIVDFIGSRDCNTCFYLSDCDYSVFQRFMEEQPIYKNMVNIYAILSNVM